jgi:hypothetical protein
MSDERPFGHPITVYARVLNAAHLLAEESAHKLHELASRYPDALPPEIVHPLLARAGGQNGAALPGQGPSGSGEDGSAGAPL